MTHADFIRREYDELAASYDQRWSRYITATLKETMDSLELSGNERVLDVPIGTGELAARLLERWSALRIVGVDLSPQMLKQATTKPILSSTDLHEGCVTRLPFFDSEFDIVFCVNSFHYFSDPRASLRELRRVLRQTGRLVLVDWCHDYLACKLCSVWLRLVDRAFHRTYSHRACRDLLTDCGFQILKSRRFRVDWVWGMMRFEARPFEARPFETRPFEAHPFDRLPGCRGTIDENDGLEDCPAFQRPSRR